MLAEILGPDLVIVLLIALVLFGGSKLPSLARSLGSAKSEFEKGLRESASEAPASEAPAPAPEAEQVTLTRAELDALIADREARARRDGPARDD
jgi:sec-independent protein translocase protein TatA